MQLIIYTVDEQKNVIALVGMTFATRHRRDRFILGYTVFGQFR